MSLRTRVRTSFPRRRRLLALVLAAVLTPLFVPTAPSVALVSAPPTRVAKDGFGDGAKNSYAWSMMWFKKKLYVGTARQQLCVEGATYDFYFPGKGYNPAPASGLTCPANMYDMDLRAQIWQYTPKTGAWKMVYQAPADIPNPRAPGKFVSRDIGYRGMVIHKEKGGKQSLYIGGVTADEYIPEIGAAHPPRLLRTTDGRHFKPVAASPGFIDDPFGHQRAMGFRALASYKNHLYVTATGGLTGDGVVMEVRKPTSKHAKFVQVSPKTMQAFDMEVFDKRLYVGAGSSDNGYSVWRTNLKGSPAKFVPVVTGGAGRGAAIDSVVSMQTYRGRLYVGSSGWDSLFPGSELIRISPDDRWDVVVGNPRVAEGTYRWPLSGLFDGFGNLFNGHFWRMSPDRGGLFMGTNDWSWALRDIPIIDPLLRPGYGFDLYATCDGTSWTTETTNAFGDGLYNYGLRAMASTKYGFFMGSANQSEGTSIWKAKHARCHAAAKGMHAAAVARADVESCGTSLSWSATPGVRRYTVSRAEPTELTGVTLKAPLKLPNGYRLSESPTVIAGGSTPLETMGKYVEIGTSSGTGFVDRTAPKGVHVQYSIRPADDPSATATVIGQGAPSASPRACTR